MCVVVLKNNSAKNNLLVVCALMGSCSSIVVLCFQSFNIGTQSTDNLFQTTLKSHKWLKKTCTTNTHNNNNKPCQTQALPLDVATAPARCRRRPAAPPARDAMAFWRGSNQRGTATRRDTRATDRCRACRTPRRPSNETDCRPMWFAFSIETRWRCLRWFAVSRRSDCLVCVQQNDKELIFKVFKQE